MRTIIFLCLLLLSSWTFSSCKKDSPKPTTLSQITFRETIWAGTVNIMDPKGKVRITRKVSVSFTNDSLVYINMYEDNDGRDGIKAYKVGERTITFSEQKNNSEPEIWYLTAMEDNKITLQQNIGSPWDWGIMVLERKA